ncbi:hypothetical protein Pcac1_g4838 [Phytophthora cactorum]|uniref:Uncharacterized protein n=1 Tax=Phytophthora cactorum TaxID=29920 RepID=A0A329RS98_9STRA|nr:hypothetical protein Pcac1_g4838 [Phytophthora cactorum]KAG2838666.1 hypothetical protein PC112_g4401 [Phytophthora cactorum]KAG2841278.1 hypothetical protein PC111_g3173 [Phytophthora cactorum]KAG2862651.1 hypothetical protein PC113_g6138 [Phytophthora cactorum]KAG2911825.1 hypothetical protein PC114_g9216 [Phytophthora cactorum]
MDEDGSSEENGNYVSEVIVIELELNQQRIAPLDEESDSKDSAADQTLGWFSESSSQTNNPERPDVTTPPGLSDVHARLQRALGVSGDGNSGASVVSGVSNAPVAPSAVQGQGSSAVGQRFQLVTTSTVQAVMQRLVPQPALMQTTVPQSSMIQLATTQPAMMQSVVNPPVVKLPAVMQPVAKQPAGGQPVMSHSADQPFPRLQRPRIPTVDSGHSPTKQVPSLGKAAQVPMVHLVQGVVNSGTVQPVIQPPHALVPVESTGSTAAPLIPSGCGIADQYQQGMPSAISSVASAYPPVVSTATGGVHVQAQVPKAIVSVLGLHHLQTATTGASTYGLGLPVASMVGGIVSGFQPQFATVTSSGVIGQQSSQMTTARGRISGPYLP